MSHSVSETVEDVGSHRIKEASVLSIPDLSVQRVRSMNAIRQLKPLSQVQVLQWLPFHWREIDLAKPRIK